MFTFFTFPDVRPIVEEVLIGHLFSVNKARFFDAVTVTQRPRM